MLDCCSHNDYRQHNGQFLCITSNWHIGNSEWKTVHFQFKDFFAQNFVLFLIFQYVPVQPQKLTCILQIHVILLVRLHLC